MAIPLISEGFGSAGLGHKNKLHQTLDCWSRDIINFNFLKGSGTSFSKFCACMIFLHKYFCYIAFE